MAATVETGNTEHIFKSEKEDKIKYACVIINVAEKHPGGNVQ